MERYVVSGFLYDFRESKFWRKEKHKLIKLRQQYLCVYICMYTYIYIYGAERKSGREGRIFFNNKDINHGLEDI